MMILPAFSSFTAFPIWRKTSTCEERVERGFCQEKGFPGDTRNAAKWECKAHVIWEWMEMTSGRAFISELKRGERHTGNRTDCWLWNVIKRNSKSIAFLSKICTSYSPSLSSPSRRPFTFSLCAGCLMEQDERRRCWLSEFCCEGEKERFRGSHYDDEGDEDTRRWRWRRTRNWLLILNSWSLLQHFGYVKKGWQSKGTRIQKEKGGSKFQKDWLWFKMFWGRKSKVIHFLPFPFSSLSPLHLTNSVDFFSSLLFPSSTAFSRLLHLSLSSLPSVGPGSSFDF